jgi:extracellular factor (EF) 3-hydroxypalmitic acid methyl ester biosynthesis protein
MENQVISMPRLWAKAPKFKNDHEEQVSEFLDYLIENGGPDPEDYEKFTSIVNEMNPSEIIDFRDRLKRILKSDSLIGHGLIKPYGYAGDFELINKIYQFHINEDIRNKNWDLFFQNQPAAKAVRNRKDCFIEYCKKLVLRKQDAKVLILGSGPGTDVYEFISSYPGNNNISFELVDYDQAAIDFSMKQNVKFNGQISYNRINALRFTSYKEYDLIWSAGMFDYFKDKHFSFLIRKYFSCLSEGGEMVISNFSTKNPSQRFMEIIDWCLNIRTESDLVRLAAEASIDKEMVSVDKEPLGINLFLKIRKS